MSRAVALLLTVATGAAGLVYEVTWERMLATLLGSHAAATAAVLAFFLGGLAAGYALFGAWTHRVAERRGPAAPREILRIYGVVEASIGFYALCFELLFAVARRLSILGPAQPALSFAFDALLAAALVVPGAALMGGTIPMLTQALSPGVATSTRIHAAVYGLNTLGAFFGALAASFFLIPALGLVGTLRGMGIVNLVAGAGYVLLSVRIDAGEAPAPAASLPPLRLGSLAAVACLLGFAMMTVETTLIRMGSLALGASLFSFATVVAVFVLCIALGSLAVGALPRVSPSLLPICAWCLLGALALLYGPLQDTPYYAHRLRIAFRDDPAAFVPYQLAVLAWMLLWIGPPVVLSGALLPLCFDRVRRLRGELGDAAGRLYGWNTVGSLCGALIGGYALFYWLDLHQVYRVAVAAIAVAAALLTPPRPGLARVAQTALLAGCAVLGLALLPAWSPERLTIGAFRMRAPQPTSLAGPEVFTASEWRGHRIAFFDDDPTASISVRERGAGSTLQRSIITNGKSDSSVTGDYTTTAMIGLVPAWLAHEARRSFVVGYGTGVTASELALLDESKEVIVAEISPAVARAAPLFDYANHEASRNREIHVVQGDAYRVLLRTPGRFDVIASEPSNPWVNGVEMLYSEEFLRAAKSKLTPGGVFCQWFHTYETDAATLGLVLRTYAAVFDHVAVWNTIGADLLLIGTDDTREALDIRRLSARAERPDFRAGFGRAGIDGFAGLLAHETWPLDVLEALHLEGPVHTLMHPRLAYAAARAFFVAHDAALPPTAGVEPAEVGLRNSLLHRYAKLRGGLAEEEWAQVARESCKLSANACVTILAAWQREHPVSPEREAVRGWLRVGGASRRVDLGLVPAIARLYQDHYPAPQGEVRFAHLARTAGERFIDYFHHAVPFDRRSLASVFTQCAGTEQRDACGQVRRELEEAIGPLEGTGAQTAAAPDL